MRSVTGVWGDKTPACAHPHADPPRGYAYVSYVPTRTTYPLRAAHPPLRSRTLSPLGLEAQAAGAFAIAIALGAAALILASSMLGAALLLGLAALLGRRALTVVASDAPGARALRPRDQAGYDAVLAVLLGGVALLLASAGDAGAAAGAAIAAMALGALALSTRYLAR